MIRGLLIALNALMAIISTVVVFNHQFFGGSGSPWAGAISIFAVTGVYLLYTTRRP